MVGQLDHHLARAEPVHQRPQLGQRRRRTLGAQRAAHRALAAPGQHQAMPADLLDDLVQVVEWAALFLTGQLARADRPTDPAVTLRAAGQQQQVPALRIGLPALRRGQAQAQLSTEHVRNPSSRAASAKRTTP
jgi:hypothetical protein